MADASPTDPGVLEFPDIAEMSDKSDLLAALSDVSVPDASSWPAPGWWLMAAVLIAVSGFIGLHRRAKRKRAADAWRREALREVTALRQALSSASDVERHALVQAGSALMRRVMMHVNGRKDTAALTDTAWLAALNKHAAAPSLKVELQPLLTDVPYETVPNDRATKKNVKALLKWMTQYIDNLPRTGDSS